MKRIILFFVLVSFILSNNLYCYGEEYKKFDIRYGMHQKTINQKYGEPLLSEDIRVDPLPKRKALYELDKSNYMILHFFLGRIYKIVLLEDMGADEAARLFKEN